ncbi:MAG TPA: tetratricopeptide repeat protein [Methylomirabilota bacterium]|nr:tetratricopeptide repeat protein [Methylomirabilota bacterium]
MSEETELAELLCRYAHQSHEKFKFATAEIALKRAIKLYPQKATLWSNLGVVCFNQDKHLEAEEALKKALELFNEDENCFPFTNYAILLGHQHRDDEARAMFNLAMEKESKRVQAKWELAHFELEIGNWEEGFKLYPYRKIYKGEKWYPKLPYPTWDGKTDLNNKTLFVQPEQGMGDRILFSRYLIWLKEKYPQSRIMYFMDPKDITFFWEFRHFIDIMPFGVPYPKADFAIYQIDLPGIHGTTLDNIPEDPGLFLKRILPFKPFVEIPEPKFPSLKVGICWTGNHEQNSNHFRSIPLEKMLQLAENPYVVLHSLHIGDGEKDIERLGAQELLYNFSDVISEKGYVKTGEIMLNMDLVVTCDTAVAHLAGVLKVPCMTLLCNTPFWVWLRDRDDCVWYPKTMKLIRQPSLGDWQSVINEVKAEIDQIVSKKFDK